MCQNFALYHCLGPSIQTALFNGPLVVIVGWGIDKPMDLNFEIFMVVVLILSILVVGRFLQDGSSNYLEGTLLVVSILFLKLYLCLPPLLPVIMTSNKYTVGLCQLTLSSSYTSSLQSQPGIIPTWTRQVPYLRPRQRQLQLQREC
jgi:Ca2+:H+ antiporter